MLQIVLVLFTALSTPMTTPANITDGGGGPDGYGYRWIDNDTVAPNAPVFNWIDISSVGTQVTGLGDDNVVGPFSIGFSFPFYWYRVNSFYLSSNGFISFSDNFNASATFSNTFPNPARPNDVVSPFMSDFDFTVGTPSCYIWTNTAQDTCVITYQNLRWWNQPSSNCSLQIILAKPDSSITFQFKRMIGYAGYAAANEGNVTGIENILGNLGLTYLFNAVPAQNAIHDTLAVKFYPPQTTAYQVIDVGIRNAMSDNSGGYFVTNNVAKTMWANVKNTGNQPVGVCTVFCRVRNAANSIVYSQTQVIPSMTAGQVDSVVFSPAWTPTATGLYKTVFRAKTTGDMFPPNDSVVIETRVVTYPGELYYDDGTVDEAISWQGNAGGMGVKFIPPQYPCRITSARAYLYYNATPLTCTLWVLKGDGPNGSPGTVLGRGNINVNLASPGTWYSISLDATINSGSFFVGVTSDGSSNPYYCMDTSFPIANQTWEYTNGWAPYRSTNEDDALMRATVQLGSDIIEMPPSQLVSTQPTLHVSPNPFINSVKIQFAGSMAPLKIIEIYNTAGERVTKLTTTNDFVMWNGHDYLGNKLSRGIYFAKLKNEDAPVVKVLLLN
jgi:hypothetical protein